MRLTSNKPLSQSWEDRFRIGSVPEMLWLYLNVKMMVVGDWNMFHINNEAHVMESLTASAPTFQK